METNERAVNRISRTDLWRYCTEEHSREMLLSFRLFGENGWPKEKEIACLYALSNHTENHYEKIKIPKKSGGTRTLTIPDPLLKNVQKNILHHILDGFSAADSAMAYRPGKRSGKEGKSYQADRGGIFRNAAMHVGKPVVMKMDIEDFFGNITFPMVLHHAFPAKYFPPSVGNLLTSLCCCGEYLPQGAPTSPAISNLVMKPFDEYMEGWCLERNITYSRYCDDMTFSGDFDVKPVRGKVSGFLREMGFELNSKKTRILTRGVRQSVTGLVVNEKVQVSGEYRRELRKDIYYCRKFGAEEHLKHKGIEKRYWFSEGGADVRRYLQVLLGRVRYVRLTRPEDLWLREAETWLKEKLREEQGER